MKIPFSGAVSLLAAIALVVISGCGESYTGPPLEPCKGSITLDGAPLAEASINMTNSQKSCSARSDAEGKWEMKTGQGAIEYDGAPLGTFKVTVVKSETPDIGMEDPGEEASEDEMNKYREAMEAYAMANPEPKSLIPAKYTSPNTTDLSITVEEGGKEDHVLTLTGG